jgi:hypothetical protein
VANSLRYRSGMVHQSLSGGKERPILGKTCSACGEIYIFRGIILGISPNLLT